MAGDEVFDRAFNYDIGPDGAIVFAAHLKELGGVVHFPACVGQGE